MTKYIIDFLDSATEDQISTYLTTNSCEVVQVFDKLGKIYLVRAPALPPLTSFIEVIFNDNETELRLLADQVINVQSVKYNTISIPHDDEKQWWKIYSSDLSSMNESIVPINLHKNDVIVYLMDSGIDINHPEFTDRRVELFYSSTPDDFTDYSGHGTSLASLIVGNTCSINDSILKVVKIFKDTSLIRLSDLLSAFHAVISDVVDNSIGYAVVNMSWSIDKNAYVEKQIQTLIDLGIVVVAAAGNSGKPIEDVTPASMKDVVTVGSYNQDFKPSDFSDYGGESSVSLTTGLTNYGELDGWAPGEKIWTALPNGQYGFVYGTSSAAAIYSACVAYNVSSDVEGEDVLEALSNSAVGQIWAKGHFWTLDLLDLSDPKYKDSPNKICMFYTQRQGGSRILVGDSHLFARVGTAMQINLYEPDYTKSVKLLTPLPEYCKLVERKLWLCPTTEPTSETGVELSSVEFEITPMDETIEPFIRKIVLLVFSTAFNKDELPANDPLIEIIQQYAYVCYDSFPSCGWPCGPGLQVCNGPSKGFYCYGC